jgi:hypothetical protein
LPRRPIASRHDRIHTFASVAALDLDVRSEYASRTDTPEIRRMKHPVLVLLDEATEGGSGNVSGGRLAPEPIHLLALPVLNGDREVRPLATAARGKKPGGECGENSG